MASGPVADGVLHGDLIVVGSGDPSIGGRDGPGDRGVRRAGPISSRRPAFAASTGASSATTARSRRARPRRRLVVGRPRAGYAAGVSALQFNESAVHVTVAPGPRAATARPCQSTPPGSGLTIRNHLSTVAQRCGLVDRRAAACRGATSSSCAGRSRSEARRASIPCRWTTRRGSSSPRFDAPSSRAASTSAARRSTSTTRRTRRDGRARGRSSRIARRRSRRWRRR